MDHTGEMSEGQGPQAKPSLWRRVRGILGLVLVAGGFWVLVDSATEAKGTAYFFEADQATAKLGELVGKTVRIKGNVIIGSYQNPEGTQHHRFDIEEKGQVIHVRFDGPLPDVFKEGMPVVAEGVIDAEARLKATEVVAKCPSKYEADKVSDQAKQKLEGQY